MAELFAVLFSRIKSFFLFYFFAKYCQNVDVVIAILTSTSVNLSSKRCFIFLVLTPVTFHLMSSPQTTC